jgi:hypothetical protein
MNVHLAQTRLLTLPDITGRVTEPFDDTVALAACLIGRVIFVFERQELSVLVNMADISNDSGSICSDIVIEVVGRQGTGLQPFSVRFSHKIRQK